MNARLPQTPPESLLRQTEACAALGKMMLDAGSTLTSLQFGTLKSSLALAKSQLNAAAKPETVWQDTYSTILEHSLAETREFVRQMSDWSAKSPNHVFEILDASLHQSVAAVRQATEEQIQWMRTLNKALSSALPQR